MEINQQVAIYTFTEQGVTILASSLNSNTAIQISIEVVRTFIGLKKIENDHRGFQIQLNQLEAELELRNCATLNIYEPQEFFAESCARFPGGGCFACHG